MHLLYFDQSSGSGYLSFKGVRDVFSYSYEIDPVYGDFIFDISKTEKITGVDIFGVIISDFERLVEGDKNIYFFNNLRNSKVSTKTHINNTSYYSEGNSLFGKIRVEYTTDGHKVRSITIDRSVISDPDK